ncbi:MAG: polysaccharide biosynthesis tyrosine autokinase [Chloroflexota bacterium]|nr:polysaccharide biosynthesis tyrosine autokinase [Dehalococcoidia bacterium]MDW8254320.1 polysaccharide biosynthesis tyrosine autokinase [Chloroflexota bacterium]
MQLRDYGRVIARRWWIILLFAVAGAATAYGLSKLETPMYRSSAKLYVSPVRPDYGLTLVIQNLIRSYGQQITSERFLRQINEELKLDLPPGALRSRTNVLGTADNLAIQIDFDDPNPLVAQRVARALAQKFVEEHQRRMLAVEPRDKIEIDIFDEPQPGTLTRPRTAANTVAGAVLGVLLGVVTVFLLEYLDDTLKGQESVDRFIKLPVVGTIPRLVGAGTKRGRAFGRWSPGGAAAMTQPSGNGRLINHRNPKSPVAEAYRQLRTNIQFASLDKPLRTILLTSAGPQEGKSTTLANLAIAIAQTGSKVIAVDCDLRRPTLHQLFGVKNVAGLTTLMVAPTLDDLCTQETDVPNLLVLPTGPLPPNPSELLGSRRMAEIIERLRGEADYILFDSPPVAAVTDAAVLATRVDGVLLVVMANKTKRELAQKARAALEKVGANLIGVVLNNVKYDTSLHNYYAD